MQNDKENRLLANRSLSCPIVGSKQVISDNLLWATALIQIPLGSWGVGEKEEVSLEPEAKVAFSSK